MWLGIVWPCLLLFKYAASAHELSLEQGPPVLLLVESRQGYRNLSRLLTQAQGRAPKGEARARLAPCVTKLRLRADTRTGTVRSGVLSPSF